jgi:hypothetical protein
LRESSFTFCNSLKSVIFESGSRLEGIGKCGFASICLPRIYDA